MSIDTADGKRLRTTADTARHFMVHPATVENWLSRGFIRAFRVDGAGPILFDIDEVDRAFKVHAPKMRDGRRRGARGRVVAIVVPEGSEL
ncbi:helix-turn-helix domain-containing protein [Microbacterium sp. Root180]|uniref:helix-turn-helix domain-containing protein n=1 Tax=Microbacterium sp. Root180 TaxID=1736483 RepID=UPI0006F4F094|nr:helix-turn-helix domain-containing protein [Microbacterium sp. Root180]KRB38817.1 hypothetical protein ASD93_02435 [Microbacterium sp. Root180]